MEAAHTAHSWAAEARQLAVIRATTRRWLLVLGVDEDVVGDIVCAVNEAAANAIDHAYLDAPHPGLVGVDLAAGPDEMHISISDQGVWRRPRRPGLDGRGRGIELMTAMIHSVEIHHTSAGTVVDLRHPISRAADQGSRAG